MLLDSLGSSEAMGMGSSMTDGASNTQTASFG